MRGGVFIQDDAPFSFIGDQTMEDFFKQEDIISIYTRAQAIEDGILIDVSELAKEAGFVVPIAVTNGVWSSIVVPPKKAKEQGECETGRLWDVLYIASLRIKEATGTEVLFHILATKNRGTRKLVQLKANAGPGDNGELVITIMLPNED